MRDLSFVLWSQRIARLQCCLVMNDSSPDKNPETSNKKKRRRSGWRWALGLMAAGVGGAGVFLLRGCWHTKMSWPIREGDHSYQVCLGCGIKRLFNEEQFHSYGPYAYDVKELIARERVARMSHRKTA